MINKKLIGVLGTGIFLCLTLQSISYLSEKLFTEALLSTNLNPIYVCGIAEYSALILVLITFILAIKKVNHLDLDKGSNMKKLFLNFVLAYITIHLVGWLLAFIMSITYQNAPWYLDARFNYEKVIKVEYIFQQFAISTPILIIKYSFITIYILKEIKLFTTQYSK